jgi:hypothetical protein
MNNLLKISFSLYFSFLIMSAISAQPGRHGGGPSEFIEREKQAVFRKIEDLSEDQKLLVDGIYDEFGVSLIETFQSRDENTTRESMRAKIESLREEKDGLIGDVLNEEQYLIYSEISSSQRRKGKNTEQPTEEN